MKKKSGKPLTRMIARFVRAVAYRDIPERVREPLLQSITDGVGCGIKGSTTDFSRSIAHYVNKWRTRKEATIWGTTCQASAPFAAMVNAASTHAWDYDDGVYPGIIHPACVVLPTALAVAERAHNPIRGKALITGIAAGYEISNLLGTALGSKAFVSTGFYSSIPAIFGAVATAGKLMKLDEEQLVRAMGLAATQAAGLYSATLAKRFNAAKAAEGGVFAADLAQSGLEAPADSIEADHAGFITTFSRTPNLAVIDRDLGKFRFEIFHKFYPCIRSNQASVENVRMMLKENPGISAESIRKIVSYVDTLTIVYTMKTTGGGTEGVRTPGNALISLPYCVAALVVDGELSFRQFEPQRIGDQKIQRLMRKVELRADASIDQLRPEQRYRCTTEIHLADGRVIKRFLPAAKGDPSNRLTSEELYYKFMMNATSVFKERAARALFSRLEDIERVADVRTIARSLRASPSNFEPMAQS
jgi:aconitate decarboxylase